jgi:hypothetical protein
MSYIGSYSIKPPRLAWTDSRGRKRHVRSSSRANIFAISSGVQVNDSPYAVGFPTLINVKFHSSQTWRGYSLHSENASTELMLTHDDAERLIFALQSALNTYDEEAAKSAV